MAKDKATPEERKARAALTADQAHALDWVIAATKKRGCHPRSSLSSNTELLDTDMVYCIAPPDRDQANGCTGSFAGCPHREETGGTKIPITSFKPMGRADGPNWSVVRGFCEDYCKPQYDATHPKLQRNTGGSGLARAAIVLHGIDTAEQRERNLDKLTALYGLDTDTREQVGALLDSCAVRTNALAKADAAKATAFAAIANYNAIMALIGGDPITADDDDGSDVADLEYSDDDDDDSDDDSDADDATDAAETEAISA